MGRDSFLEEKDEAATVHVNENLTHKAHGYACLYLTDENVKVQGGFSHETRQSSGMIMVLAVTRKGPLATQTTSGFPINERLFRGRKGRRKSGEGGLHTRDEEAAEILKREIFQDYQVAQGKGVLEIGWSTVSLL